MQVEMQVEKGINFAERYLEALEELFPQFTMFGLVGIGLGILLALLFTFFGYKLIRFLLAAAGFVIGLVLGGSLAIRLDLDDKMIVIISLVLAVLLAVIVGLIYKFGLFVVFAAAGYNLALIILPVFYSGEYTRWIALGAGLLLGGLSAWLGKVCIIAASSAAGGLALSDILITEVLARVATIESSRTETIIVLVLGFILAAAAMRYQFSTTEGDE